MNIISIDIELSATTEPPTELRLFRAGLNKTSKGDFLFDEAAGLSVMAAFREAKRDSLPFDVGHGMLNPSCVDSHYAFGWFKPAVKNGELWATDIAWTQRATSALKSRELRYLSPAFRADYETKRVLALINVALTNIPATVGAKPIINSGVTMPPEDTATLTERVTTLEAQLAESKAANRNTRIAQLSVDGRLPPSMHAYAQSLSESEFERYVAALPATPLSPSTSSLTPRQGSVASLSAEAIAVARMFNQDVTQLAEVHAELMAGESPWKFTPKTVKS